MSATQSESPLPTKELEVVQQVTLPPGFIRVTVCLWRDQSPEVVCKVPPDPLSMAVVLGPAVATMTTSHIVKDKVMGVTYMDTMTTLVGQVTLSGPRQEVLGPGAYHRGCHGPCVVSKLMTAFGQRSELMTTFEWRSELITAFGWKG